MTREALRARGVPFAGWIANKLVSEMPLANANIDTLTTRFGVEPLGVVPAGAPRLDPKSDPLPDWAEQTVKKLVSP